MNESTFETHLAACISNVFPTIAASSIETQTVLPLKLGHRILAIDGPASYANGRADIVLRIGGKPTVLLELKAPGIELTEEDLSQAVSYSRLHEPMIPIVVLTNGSDVQIYSSFDRSPIEGASLDEARIVAVVSASSKQASLSVEQAIRNLLEGNPEIWAAAIRSRTEESIKEMEGSIADFTLPLWEHFRFPRKASVQLAHAFEQGERVLALVAPPISGKTNVIAEFCERAEAFGNAVLYIDCLQTSNLLEEVANALTDSFGASVSADKAYDWLRIGIGDQREDRPRLILVLDSLVPEDANDLIKQATGILKNVGNNVRILFSLTDPALEKIRFTPGRTTLTKLGRDTKVLLLRSLDDGEIDVAARNLSALFRIELPPGSRFESSMREPRILRMLIAMHGPVTDIPDGMHGRLPSIVPSDVLVELWDTTAGATELRSDLIALAEAYLEDEDERAKSSELTIMSIGVGTMTTQTAQKVLGEVVFQRLLQNGYIKRMNGAGQMLIVPTVPELLSAALVSILQKAVVTISESDGDEAAITALLRFTSGIPLGDRVAALVLQHLVSHRPSLFNSMFFALLEDEPKQEEMRPGSFLMQLVHGEPAKMRYVDNSIRIEQKDGTEVVFPLDEEDGPMHTTSNLHPWNILSHLAYAPVGMVQDGQELPLGPGIMDRIGRFRSTLKNFGAATISDQVGNYEHNLPGFGTVPCPARGIVEPIVYAMQLAIQRYGSLMEKFVNESIEDGDPALLMRLYVAASSLEEISEPETKERAKRMEHCLSRALDGVFDVIHGSGDESEGPSVE